MKPNYVMSLSFLEDDESNGLLSADAFDFHNTGDHWLYSSDNWQPEIEDIEAMGFNNLNLKSNNTLSVQDKTLFRYPKLDLPRQKVDLLKEKYNCKVIRDPDKADIHIVYLKFIESLITKEWKSSITFNNTFKILKFIKESGFLSPTGLVKVKSIIATIPHDAMVSVRLNYLSHVNYNSTSKLSIVRDKISDFIDSNKFNPHSRDFILESINSKNFNLLLHAKAQIVIDTEICEIIDQDLAVLDISQYDTIKTMIMSNDIILVSEIIGYFR